MSETPKLKNEVDPIVNLMFPPSLHCTRFESLFILATRNWISIKGSLKNVCCFRRILNCILRKRACFKNAKALVGQLTVDRPYVKPFNVRTNKTSFFTHRKQSLLRGPSELVQKKNVSGQSKILCAKKKKRFRSVRNLLNLNYFENFFSKIE